MKIYIAGKLTTDDERKFLEKLDDLCKSLGYDTFLPHRDVGIANDINDVNNIFNEDIIQGFKDINLVIAVLNGFHVGAGTAWELGYAYAKKIPSIGIKLDEPVYDSLESLSSILIASMPILDSMEKLKQALIKFKLNQKV